MAKRKGTWTEDKVARYIKEGRGSGELSGYKPWLTNQDFPSEGRTHRIKGWKSNREHQLFSDIERNYFYILEWAENVIDIREQYPLDREKTIKIADNKHLVHSIDKKTGSPIVMTTDFLITLRDEKGIRFIARTIKPAAKLNDKRVIEKLEIERQYWEDEKVDWSIVSELDIPSTLWRNIELIHPHYELEEQGVLLAETLYCILVKEQGRLLNVLNAFDFNYSLEAGSALAMFKHLLAKKIIRLDMQQKINLKMEIGDLSFEGLVEEGDLPYGNIL
ncbi:TnsA endonuclease N-terminal domain-containing protein [Bacillus sp. ISL-39]|uniref:TnsA endonuclease N-terminal domain-containing protein n=1 Tax=Bacillus sp. ISL-39 TaxID=2819124 RepID=UPI001BE5D08B|nr:TnsA endonuclease N-terminal domain-containing protein [Bacillus sp. ISL-39]MBT2639379.1 heteromeric transposase endonuclease subunit TnsA [Bacillus sp. ISL-39]